MTRGGSGESGGMAEYFPPFRHKRQFRHIAYLILIC